ncbi:MAG: sulfotransferase domain-containing protein [Anaerolineales bacterium]|nr:sulfotransferase domain-containing protein [Anaerolineales bacterium]
MIILSVGMPRAGSGWYYNLTNDLMLANGAQDARKIRERYHLQNILTEVNCNIGALTPRRLIAVTAPSLLGNTFVIKAHAAPTPLALQMIRRGMIRAAYIYRDPRDAMLSAMENGQRARQRGRPNAFSHLVDFEAALDFTLANARIWQAWMECEAVLHTRYEDLLANYEAEAKRLAMFLGLDLEAASLSKVIDKYRSENTQPDQKGLHFSQGKIGRFRQKLSAEQQGILAEKLAPYLERMGYEK